jgi:hypothetical protein
MYFHVNIGVRFKGFEIGGVKISKKINDLGRNILTGSWPGAPWRSGSFSNPFAAGGPQR